MDSLNAVQRLFAAAIRAHNARMHAIQTDASMIGRAYRWERQQQEEQSFHPVWLWAVRRWGLSGASDIVWVANK